MSWQLFLEDPLASW